MEQKHVLSSKTIWGVLIAAAGVVTESAGLLPPLIGDEWTGRAVVIAGLILAFWGRLVANKEVTLLLAAMVLPLCMIGCAGSQAGNAARQEFLSPAAQLAWPGVQRDALYGIEAQERDGLIGPGVADSFRERVTLFDRAVAELGGGS